MQYENFVEFGLVCRSTCEMLVFMKQPDSRRFHPLRAGLVTMKTIVLVLFLVGCLRSHVCAEGDVQLREQLPALISEVVQTPLTIECEITRRSPPFKGSKE